jgi:hypothetical protein
MEGFSLEKSKFKKKKKKIFYLKKNIFFFYFKILNLITLKNHFYYQLKEFIDQIQSIFRRFINLLNIDP